MKVSERVLVASLILVLASVALAQAGERPCPGNYTCVPVAAGTYHTDEFLLPLTFTVADGWEFWLDSPNHVALGRAGWETRELEFIQTALRICHNITALNQDCSESAQPGVPMGAAGLVDYWRSLPSVASTAPMEVEVGGLTGLMFDVSVEPSWTESCDWSLDRPIALLMYAPRPNPTQHGIVPGERIRFYVLDHADGNVVIEVAHTPDSPVSWDEWMEMTGSVIDSFEFGGGMYSRATRQPSSSAVSGASQAPVGIIAIGHSGMMGIASDPNDPDRDAPENSWATGSSPGVNSLYQRLGAAYPETAGNVANLAQAGSPAANLAGQARNALRIVPTPRLVVIQTIDNDIRLDGTDADHVDDFGAAVEAALEVIVQASPETRILIVSNRGRPADYFAFAAGYPEAVAMNGDFFDAEGRVNEELIAALTAVIKGYEAEQARVCALFTQCMTDGGVYATFVDDEETLAADFNHLSVKGNARTAEILWPVVEELLGLR